MTDVLDLSNQPQLQQQPQFPLTNFQITPDGMIISIMLATNISINQVVDEATMSQICAKWIETRRDIKTNLALIQDIKKSKIN